MMHANISDDRIFYSRLNVKDGGATSHSITTTKTKKKSALLIVICATLLFAFWGVNLIQTKKDKFRFQEKTARLQQEKDNIEEDIRSLRHYVRKLEEEVTKIKEELMNSHDETNVFKKQLTESENRVIQCSGNVTRKDEEIHNCLSRLQKLHANYTENKKTSQQTVSALDTLTSDVSVHLSQQNATSKTPTDTIQRIDATGLPLSADGHNSEVSDSTIEDRISALSVKMSPFMASYSKASTYSTDAESASSQHENQ